MTKFEIKSFKSQRGIEGPGYSLYLWVDGKRACDVIDEGCGGCVMFHWFDQESQRKWDEFVAAHPEVDYSLHGDGSEMRKPDGDMVMATMVEEFEIRKKLLRSCRTQTLYRLKDDKPDSYWVMKTPFTPAVAERLRQKHGDALIEIINETLVKE